MDGEDAIDTFMALTNAPRHVAQHVLDAHAGDLEAGISFYLEGGGVGHGVTGPSGSLDPVLYTAALSAQEQPRSSPLTVRSWVDVLSREQLTVARGYPSSPRAHGRRGDHVTFV
uniref:Uncharacterized protein n=1 Tax=Auxenochlorella protothecoides TaxID=3075 RepID=A0A1D1ZRC0_AUXPR